MAAFKYNSTNTNHLYLRSSVQPRMGASYLFDGRLYFQIKKGYELVYADINYKLNIKLMSWTANSIDIELDIKNISITEEYMIYTSKAKSLIETLFDLENKILYLRINNVGRIVKIFNLSELKESMSLVNNNELSLADLIETNPIISAFISGQIEMPTKNEKTYSSLINPAMLIKSKLQTDCKRDKFLNSVNTLMSTCYSTSQESFIKPTPSTNNDKINNLYELSSLISSNKGVDKILPYSIAYSIEEKLGDNTSSFISVGIESIVSGKEVGVIAKLRDSIYKAVSLLF